MLQLHSIVLYAAPNQVLHCMNPMGMWGILLEKPKTTCSRYLLYSRMSKNNYFKYAN